jgi:hypothetical protein
MTSIQISELHPIGFELFHDDESFLDNLTDDEIRSITGGFLSLVVTAHFRYPRLLPQSTYNYHVISALGNSVNNNTINGQTHVGVTYSNHNSIN